MKKYIALVLCLVMCLTLLTACGSTKKTETAASGEVKTIESGKLIMGTNAQFPPYELVSDGEGFNKTGFEGIDVEIASAVAGKLGLELVIDDMEFDAALSAVQNGKCDVVFAGLSYSKERDKIMDFSTPYAQGVQVVIVKDGGTVTSADDFANASLIGTQRGTTGYIYCCDDYGDDHVAAYDNGAQAVQALLNGQVDCVVIDKQPAEEYVKANEGLSILETEYVVEDYCAAVAEGNTALQTAINNALADLTKDGTIQGIIDTYIKAD